MHGRAYVREVVEAFESGVLEAIPDRFTSGGLPRKLEQLQSLVFGVSWRDSGRFVRS